MGTVRERVLAYVLSRTIFRQSDNVTPVSYWVIFDQARALPVQGFPPHWMRAHLCALPPEDDYDLRLRFSVSETPVPPVDLQALQDERLALRRRRIAPI